MAFLNIKQASLSDIINERAQAVDKTVREGCPELFIFNIKQTEVPQEWKELVGMSILAINEEIKEFPNWKLLHVSRYIVDGNTPIHFEAYLKKDNQVHAYKFRMEFTKQPKGGERTRVPSKLERLKIEQVEPV